MPDSDTDKDNAASTPRPSLRGIEEVSVTSAATESTDDASPASSRSFGVCEENSGPVSVRGKSEIIDDVDSNLASSSSVDNEEAAPGLDLNDLELIQVLGCGTYAIVWLVTRAGHKGNFALKALRSTGSEAAIRHEVDVLDRLNGVSSVTQLLGKTEDEGNSCLLLPLGRVSMMSRIEAGHFPRLRIPGLWRRHRPGLRMNEIKFYAATLILALRDIHGRNIVHRDLKSENILIDENGCVS